MISSLHYISQGNTPEEHIDNIRRMYEAGIHWVQLRMKDTSPSVLLKTARAAMELSREFCGKLIINDFPEIAAEIDAHGVHLGKEDVCPVKARTMLGSEKIIGGTANTLEDCKYLWDKKIDYIGLGPFRYTSTKRNLSPILGLSTYQQILEKLKKDQIPAPIIAIGGIKAADIAPLWESGIHGVAISGILTEHSHPDLLIHEIFQQFKRPYHG